MTRRLRVVDLFFLATVFTITFAKIQWNVAGALSLSDVLTIVFLVGFIYSRLELGDRRLPQASVVLLAFFILFLTVYLIGFFNLDSTDALAQYGKGMVKWLLHFGFLVAGCALLIRRGIRFYWVALGTFCAGFVANAFYGLVQLAVAQVSGANLDGILLSPLTGGASRINVFGAVEGENVYRVNALTGDPNHLGVELIVPLLVLLPLYLRLERGHRLRLPLAATLVFLFVMELSTLSRSGLLGLGVGLLILFIPYRRRLASAAFLIPLVIAGGIVAVVVSRRAGFFETVLRARVSTQGSGAGTHLDVYSFIPDVLDVHPLFGLGLNTFSVYYEFITGRTNFGPHSFYVALIVEGGIAGALLFGAYVVYLLRRLALTRRLGRELSVAREPLAARVRPLGWGLTAALVGTLAANTFYLTMIFYYFFALGVFIVAAPAVFGTAVRGRVRTM